jgi:hypothetical protein
MVLTRFVTGGSATWHDESRLNFLFQTLTILVMFAGLARYLPRPLPFLSALCTLPIFYALPKTIVYDSLAQFFVAGAAVLTAMAVAVAGRRRQALLSGMAALTAMVFLSKQSTAAGVMLGALIALLVYGGAGSLRHCLAYLALSACFTGFGSVLLSRHISVPGMLRDVFMTGAEAKGGWPGLAWSATHYVIEILTQLTILAAGGVTVIAALGLRLAGRDHGPRPSPEAPLPGRASLYLSSLGASVVVAIVASLHGHTLPILVTNGWQEVTVPVLWAGLLLFPLVMVGRRWGGESDAIFTRPLFAMFVVAFWAAFFHSLSVSEFRWTYDNNPLITLALAGFLSAGLEIARRLPGRRRAWVPAAGVAVAFLAAWARYAPQYAACRDCTNAWPEIRHLQGAMLPDSAAGMRRLVSVVRQLADNASDEVLLLPNDPNVEAWFERPRPPLSSAIVFADQYLDRYVEGDLARLRARKPKVVVLGPRNFWRSFHWDWKQGLGCERLIDLVGRDLLPASYRYFGAQPISFQGREDFMDIYVRAD